MKWCVLPIVVCWWCQVQFVCICVWRRPAFSTPSAGVSSFLIHTVVWTKHMLGRCSIWSAHTKYYPWRQLCVGLQRPSKLELCACPHLYQPFHHWPQVWEFSDILDLTSRGVLSAAVASLQVTISLVLGILTVSPKSSATCRSWPSLHRFMLSQGEQRH